MAAAFDPTELKNLLKCGICLNRFQDPRVLPCLHSYCLECLRSHISSSKDEAGAFNCPQCREKCLLPDGGADKFPKNFFVNTMKDVLPESILQEPTLKAELSGPIMCKHHDQEGEDDHGEAVTFCVQCDANFCRLCTKNHGMFIKDHKVTPVGDSHGTETKPSANCNLHQNLAINWYCLSCLLPVCSECLAEKHKSHKSDKLVNVEAALKLNMLDVAKMAAKRIDVLQKISLDVKASETRMEADLDKVSKDISDTADSLCQLIRQHERSLQGQLKQARLKAETKFKKTEEELQRSKDNILRLKSQADTLQQAPSEQALCTVLQAQVTKQQYLHQQYTAVSSAEWSLHKQLSQPRKSEEFANLGSVDYEMSTKSKEFIKTEDVSLGKPLHITQLEYKGEKATCSITLLYKTMICVAHFYEKLFSVYSDDGRLLRKVDFPGIESISGMVSVDDKTGKMAVVDSKQSKVYFVSVSQDLVMQQNLCREIPIIPYRISVNSKNELVLVNEEGTRIIVLSFEGKIISNIKVSIPKESAATNMFGILQTKYGFVVCDKTNGKVYFTNKKGHILHKSSACARPWQALQLSWGHILVADSFCKAINVLSETGELLGKLHDETSTGFVPHSICFNEAGKVLYVGCGKAGALEVRAYKLTPGDLTLLPVAQNMSDIRVNVKTAMV